MIRNYVLGFLFNGSYVLLIEKNRPDWCKGLLNGVGGKIESGESPDEAMHREALEEADVKAEWKRFATMRLSGGGIVYCFSAQTDNWNCQSLTDEPVDWYDIEFLPVNTVKHVRWLIPIALDQETVKPVDVWMQKADESSRMGGRE
jgi:8-oxo-dGTP diphosphatase